MGVEEKKLAQFFERFLARQSVFADKKALQTDYKPNEVLHRDDQINAVAAVLAPILKGERPNNLFIYGYCGTGKTLVTLFTTEKLSRLAAERKLPVRVSYVNCRLRRTADTEYRLVAQLARDLGRQLPATGLPTDEVYREFYTELDNQHCTLLLVLDEIDNLVDRTEDGILYNLIRINEQLQHSRIVIVGISNNLNFKDNLDPRVRSSLSEEELSFPRYNAVQLLDILKQRSSLAFKPGSVEDGVLEKCAATAAHENGDARRALALLRTAAELAERDGQERVMVKHLDMAGPTMEHERIIDTIRSQPPQYNAVLCAVLQCCSQRPQAVFTGEIYEHYQQLCTRAHLRPLTQRRISDILQEFDELGIIQSTVISKGRYGRTREIKLALPPQTLSKTQEIIKEGLSL
jgi:cell division control protein 6